MRLICPNCATQYEVDDSAVPAAGREVQCGSCASTWFQAPARSNVSAGKEKRGDLPDWVEEVVDEDALEEAQELPGEAPKIVSAPNEDIVSEPELEGLIDTDDLAGDVTTTIKAASKPTKAQGTDAAQKLDAAKDAAGEKPTEVGDVEPVTPEPEADQSTAQTSEQVQTEKTDQAEGAGSSAAPDTGEIEATDPDDQEAASLAKTASQAAVAATIAANLTGTTSQAAGDRDAAAPDETSEGSTAGDQTGSPDAAQDGTDAGDVSTELETAIRERTSATKEDFPAIAAAELEASKAAESDAKTAADAAIKAAEQAAAVEMAEKAAVQSIEGAEHEASDTLAQVATDLAESRIAADASETVDEQSDEESTDAIAAEIQNALENLDAGKPVPENPSQEKLSDYDVTQDHDIPEEFAAVLPDESSGPVRGPTESFDPADITIEKPDMSTPIGAQSDQPIEAAVEKASKAEQTESLAAKLKARVAEAAKAQASTSTGTAGVVLGASAAGIAAAGGRRPTAFPKRDTEELASSLRPKSAESGTIKPRLRPAATPEPKRSRFGQGFLLAVAFFVVALLIYLFRDPIITAIPALEPPLTSYAGLVDNVRLVFQDAIGKLTGIGSTETNS